MSGDSPLGRASAPRHPGDHQPSTKSSELAYWETVGLKEFDKRLGLYSDLFPLDRIDFQQTAILDVGSGALSVFERIAPGDAHVTPYDTLADDYNRIAPRKKFTISGAIPDRQFDLITLFNCLDHMNDPQALLRVLQTHLQSAGEVWIYSHVDRPFSPAEHPQNFRFWHLVDLAEDHFNIRACGLTREGRLFPYAWWGACTPRRGSGLGRAVRRLRWKSRCAITYGRFHGVRAAVKGLKLVGLRRLLPTPLRF